MAKLKVTVGPGVQAAVRAKIDEALQDDKLLKEVGDIARADIVAQIVMAKEPATGKKFASPTITPEWRERKRRLATTNKAFDAASGGGTGSARLIFTGQWIQSIVNRVTKLGGRKVIEIGPTGKHEPYIGIGGDRIGKTITNEQLGEYLREQGRDWTGFPERARKRLVTAARNFLRRKLTTKTK